MTWPADPDGDMTPILEASVEAAKERHPSGKDIGTGAHEAIEGAVVGEVLVAADRCDNDCPAAALYRLALREMRLDFCGHHQRKHFPEMEKWGWTIIGRNPELAPEGES